MSELVIFLDKINEALHKIDQLKATNSNDAEKLKDDTDELLKEIFNVVPEIECTQWIGNLETCDDEDIQIYIAQFKEFGKNEREAMVKMMEFIYKVGEILESSDLETRKFWYHTLLTNVN